MRPGGSILSHVLRHLVLIAGLVIMLAPFVWMVSTSLKPPNEIFSTKLSLLPTNWAAVENYTKAFTKVPLLRYLLNGVSCPRIFWTPICPTGGIHDEVEHEPNRNQRCE